MNLNNRLLGGVLATALTMIGKLLPRKRLGRFGWLVACVVAVESSYIVASAWQKPNQSDTVANSRQEITDRPIAIEKDGYISSDACRECHDHHYDTWHASHHRTMTQVPTDETVIADFDNRVLQHSGHTFRFYRDGDDFMMEFKKDQPDSAESASAQSFKLVLSTGAHHQQAFWYATDKGRTLGKIPFIWINKEQRWVPYGSIFVAPFKGLSMHAGGWNSNCIKCHVVKGQPRLDTEKGFDTHVAEFGISCEACHGPGEKHAAAHRNGLDLDDEDTNLVNPDHLSHQRSSQVCGQCHSVFEFFDAQGEQNFDRDGFAFRPGGDLHESRHVFRFGQDEDKPVVKEKLKQMPTFYQHQFWSDGMVRVSGREYNGMLETACHQRGTMSCLSCHDMHPGESDSRPKKEWADDQLKPAMRENQACLQCHQEYKSEEKLVMHTHHGASSSGSLCYNCHMPHTTLGLMKAMRSHTVDSPSVVTTLKTGRPNACNLCHLDKTLAWTSEHLKDWYKLQTPKLSLQEREVASSVRWLLTGDAGQRAIAAWHFGWAPAQTASGTDWMAPYLAEQLADTYDVVRFIGYHSLKDLPEFADFEYDFVASKKSREQKSRDAMKVWNTLVDRPSPAKPLLIDENGGLMKERFQTLRKQRKDPPVILIE